MDKKKKSTIKNVIKGLNKASKTHARQAQKLKKTIASTTRKRKK